MQHILLTIEDTVRDGSVTAYKAQIQRQNSPALKESLGHFSVLGFLPSLLALSLPLFSPPFTPNPN